MDTKALPPTVNLHVVGHCNFKCRYCYARFQEAKTFLPLGDAKKVITELARFGVTRATFAGGEPTLHPDLLAMLRHTTDEGLVTALVTNGSFERDFARRLFPWLRWLVVSVDSHRQSTNEAIGRRSKGSDGEGQVERVERLIAWLHEWNRHRPEIEHVRLKVNVVVNALNVDEDPSEWLLALRPERIKLLQCSVIPGENDDAVGLQISSSAFDRYSARLEPLAHSGIVVVSEPTTSILDSYAMVDPRGRFRQSRVDGYVESEPIVEAGVLCAWEQVGGCDLERFHERGGDYDSGTPAVGLRQSIIALEGLDGVGKSTTVEALSEKLGAALVRNPPVSLLHERAAADALPADARRAWYWRANRVAMEEATQHVFAGRSVVMDRCFASTSVYAAAEQGRTASNADVPAKLGRPDVVVRLHVDEESRQERQRGRNSNRTNEERRLDLDADFRSRVLNGYGALGAVVVNAMQPTDKIVDDIVRLVAAQ